MLRQEHIDWYRADILRATRVAAEAARAAERVARVLGCSGCMYCSLITRHKQVLQLTCAELLSCVNGLKEGSRTTYPFPRKMSCDASLYRGFITDTGEYIDLFNSDHSSYREMYIEEHGPERAFRMINVHSNLMKNQVQFFDRKHPPNPEQLATLRELMINARGELNFRFAYDSNHPHFRARLIAGESLASARALRRDAVAQEEGPVSHGPRPQ